MKSYIFHTRTFYKYAGILRLYAGAFTSKTAHLQAIRTFRTFFEGFQNHSKNLPRLMTLKPSNLPAIRRQ